MLLAPLKPPTCEPDQLVGWTGRATGRAGARAGAALGRACTGISAATTGPEKAISESRPAPAKMDHRMSPPTLRIACRPNLHVIEEGGEGQPTMERHLSYDCAVML